MTSRSARPRLFLDSSVLFAGVYSPNGSASDLLQLAERGVVALCASNIVCEEVRRNLHRKAPQFLDQLEATLSSGIEIVADADAQTISLVATTIDPKDAPVVAAGITSGARFLVSYDRRHLLDQQELIRQEFGIVVCTPAEFLQALSAT